jgi:ABC-type transporter Mla maintaining outer membrane lipid asymmetry ATPase subunit MlaF
MTSTRSITPRGGAAVEARSLVKRYGAVLALDRLDLTVPEGTVLGFSAPTVPERPPRFRS